MKYTFVSGVHGVGKTTILNELSKKYAVDCYSISDLIRKHGKSIRIEEKKTKELLPNQEAWIYELNQLELEQGTNLILDGHFFLINSHNEISEIPFDVLDRTEIERIVLVTADERLIQERLHLRDKYEWDLEHIKEFQTRETERAYLYASIYNIPIYRFDGNDSIVKLAEFLELSKDGV